MPGNSGIVGDEDGVEDRSDSDSCHGNQACKQLNKDKEEGFKNVTELKVKKKEKIKEKYPTKTRLKISIFMLKNGSTSVPTRISKGCREGLTESRAVIAFGDLMGQILGGEIPSTEEEELNQLEGQ